MTGIRRRRSQRARRRSYRRPVTFLSNCITKDAFATAPAMKPKPLDVPRKRSCGVPTLSRSSFRSRRLTPDFRGAQPFRKGHGHEDALNMTLPPKGREGSIRAFGRVREGSEGSPLIRLYGGGETRPPRPP